MRNKPENAAGKHRPAYKPPPSTGTNHEPLEISVERFISKVFLGTGQVDTGAELCNSIFMWSSLRGTAAQINI